MTLRQKLIKMLVDKGLFESQATEIITQSIKIIDSKQGEYKVTWDRPADEYPDVCISLWFMETIKPATLAWIDKNKPQAWFRPIFE